MARTRRDVFPAVPLPDSLDGERAKGEQLREILEVMVRALPSGAGLPSERSIAERYGVARMTVRQEIDAMVDRGLIRRVMGAGTFVAEPKISHGTTTGSFSQDMRARGLTAGAKVLVRRERPATALLVERLGVSEGDPILEFHRLRSADGTPIAVERTCLSAARFPGLLEMVEDDMSLYEVLEEHWRIEVDRATHRVSAIALDETDAGLLDVPVGMPSFLVERVAFDGAGDVIEWGRSRYRGDRYDVVFDVRPAWRRTADQRLAVDSLD